MHYRDQVIHGDVRRLGESIVHTSGKHSAITYSLLEVGEHRIKDVVVCHYLNNFLNVGDQVTLRLFRKRPKASALLLAVRTANGRVERIDGELISSTGSVLFAIYAGLMLALPLGIVVAFCAAMVLALAQIEPTARILVPTVVVAIVGWPLIWIATIVRERALIRALRDKPLDPARAERP
jgi:hypothetical protein